ncbi:MAG: hypothetical protein NT028_07825 [candidate division Zixibacteria bacterium]|nr:hypothetical protein [candidate division Zixibacteria bacterium]
MTKTRSLVAIFLIAVAVMVVLGACSDHGARITDPPGIPTPTAYFSTEIHSLLFNSCGTSGCHIGANPQHEFSVATYATITEISHHGRHVVPGFADSSALYIAVSPRYAELGIAGRMPFGRTPLLIIDQNKIRDWIDQGAKDN